MFSSVRRIVLLAPSTYRSFSTSNSLLKDIKHVTVIGAGLMGSGIAQVAAQANYSVQLTDTTDKALQNAQSIIQKSISRVARKQFPQSESEQKSFIENTLKNIQFSTSHTQKTDLVIEAIVENIDIKKTLFKKLDEEVDPEAVFCSNTSSLPISLIAEATSNKRQFAGLHFFNPVPAMKLVEVVRTDRVSNQAFEDLMEFSKRIGKKPVACKDTPGFIVNRLLVPYMMEAFRIIDRQEASIEDVDVAMKLGAGMPMGPLELADFVGLDTMKFIVDGWEKDGKLDSALTKASPTLNSLIEQGHLGCKSGKGFYDYTTTTKK
ncbi:MAG: 3-hydroxyacyl-CoA dehydrogenase [Benjaminiella poitrasii]|nr:MAG: 3-hydroxyacyl-CoA dehydrogenase [Benjaminiella poitrasii]